MERKEFLEKVLAYGRQAGFADCEVYYRGGKAFEVLILEGEVSDYENSREEGLALSLIHISKRRLISFPIAIKRPISNW